MGNPLTGDYEAVLQFATRQLNGLLGTIHQNAAIQDAPLRLLHSATLRSPLHCLTLCDDPSRASPSIVANILDAHLGGCCSIYPSDR